MPHFFFLKMLIKGKQGQIGGLPNTVLVIIFALLMLAVGFLIVQQMLDLDNLSSKSATVKETSAYVNTTGYTLAHSTAVAFNSPVITTVVNATDGNGTTLLAGNYTLTGNVVYNASVTAWADVNLTYTYKYGEASYEGVNDTISAFLSIPSLLGLLILVIIVGIVIALLFGMGGGKTGTGA